MKRSLLLFCAGFVLSSSALSDGVKVENAWVRATAPGQKVAGGFMQLTADADMVLVGGSSPIATNFELHFMRMENGVMEMRPMQEIALPKGKTVKLEPGGLHVMFIGLKGRIKAGDKAPMRLIVRGQDGKELKLDVTAKGRLPGGGH